MGNISIFEIMFPAIFTLVGLAFIMGGMIKQSNLKKKMKRCTLKTNGKVVDMWWGISQNNDKSRTYYVEFQYNVDNKEISQVERLSGSGFRKGQDVEICYNPQNYNDYYAVGNKAPKRLVIGYVSIGIISIVIAIVNAIMILGGN